MVYEGFYDSVLETLLNRLFADPWPQSYKEQKTLGQEVYAAHGYHTPVPETLLTAKKMFMKNLRSGIVPAWIAKDHMLLIKFWAVVEKIPACEKTLSTPVIKNEEPEIEEPKSKKSRCNRFAPSKHTTPKKAANVRSFTENAIGDTEQIVKTMLNGFETKLADLGHKMSRIETKKIRDDDRSCRLRNISKVEKLRQRTVQQEQHREHNQLAIKEKMDILEVMERTQQTNDKIIAENLLMINHLKTTLAVMKNGVRRTPKNNNNKPFSHSGSENNSL